MEMNADFFTLSQTDMTATSSEHHQGDRMVTETSQKSLHDSGNMQMRQSAIRQQALKMLFLNL